jgi:hypothetical protein
MKMSCQLPFRPLYTQRKTSNIKYEAEWTTDLVWEFTRKKKLLLVAWHHIFYENKIIIFMKI